MEKQRSVKIIAVVALLLAVVGVSVAFAAMSTTLNIGGTAQLETAEWEIKFLNLTPAFTTGLAEELDEPTLSDTSITGFDVKLTRPGDSIVYTFDVMNDGTIDAELGTYTKATSPTCTGISATTGTTDATTVCSNLTYTLTYTNGGTAVAQGDHLAAGVTKNLTLTLSYNGSALPADDVNITDLGITLLYVQD